MTSLNWKRYLFDFLTVVLSILMAFALSSYAENRKEKRQYQIFLNGIKEEIIVNLEEVREKYEYHKKLLEQLETNPSEANVIIKASNLKSFAWEIAQNEVFKEHVSYNLYKKLGEIYSSHKNLRDFNLNTNKLMGELNIISPYYLVSANLESFDQEEFRLIVRKGWIPIFQDMTYYEKYLLDMYEELLECWPCKL